MSLDHLGRNNDKEMPAQRKKGIVRDIL